MQQVCIYILSVITRYREGSKKHLDDPVPNSDFPVLHCLGIGSSVSGIRSYQIEKYMSKFQPIPNLICLSSTSKSKFQCLTSGCGTLVIQLTNDPKVQGSNPASTLQWEKIFKNCLSDLSPDGFSSPSSASHPDQSSWCHIDKTFYDHNL